MATGPNASPPLLHIVAQDFRGCAKDAQSFGAPVYHAEDQMPMNTITCAYGPALLEEGASAEVRAALLPRLALRTVRFVQTDNHCAKKKDRLIGFLAHDAVAFLLADVQHMLVEHVVIDDAVDPLPAWP